MWGLPVIALILVKLREASGMESESPVDAGGTDPSGERAKHSRSGCARFGGVHLPGFGICPRGLSHRVEAAEVAADNARVISALPHARAPVANPNPEVLLSCA